MQSKTRMAEEEEPFLPFSFFNPNFSSSRVQKIELSFQIFTGSSNHKMLRERTLNQNSIFCPKSRFWPKSKQPKPNWLS